MSWIQITFAIPAALLFVALVHDFLAGLGEERLWSDPIADDPQSFSYRETMAGPAQRQADPPVPQVPGFANVA